jgi:hypothetical protein
MAHHLAVGLAVMGLLLAATSGCSSTRTVEGAADASVMTPDAQSDASFDASTCVAEGGLCAAASTACGAIISSACGPSEVCCVGPCMVDGNEVVIRASSYDQSCSTDSDCIAIATGGTCLPCIILCATTTAAINRAAQPEYMADISGTLAAAAHGGGCGCPAGGLGEACCRGGMCSTDCVAPVLDGAVAETGSDAATDAASDAAAE